MNRVPAFTFLHRVPGWFRRTSGPMRVAVSAIASATLTLSVLLLSAQTAEAWVIGNCKFKDDSIDPIIYKFNDVESGNRSAFDLAQGAWDASAAAGEFQVASSNDTPEIQVYDRDWHMNWYAFTTWWCGSDKIYYGNTTNIQFNTRTANNFTSNKKKVIFIHELGHAYGLDHMPDSANTCHAMEEHVEGNLSCAPMPSTDDVGGVNDIY